MTSNDQDAYLIEQGSVLIYVVPLVDGKAGRRSFLYEAQSGEVIPGFFYRDMNYHWWCLGFAAVDEAELTVIENGVTQRLKDRFISRAAIRNYELEGFCEAVVDQYRINTVTEDGLIIRNQKSRKDIRIDTYREIYQAFYGNKTFEELEESGKDLYDCAAFLCRHQSIPIASVEKIKEACGDSFAITDIARLSHFACREILLEVNWQKRDLGPFIAFREEKPFVCYQKYGRRYVLLDIRSKNEILINEKQAESLSPKAYMFYRVLPLRKSGWKDVFSFCLRSIHYADIALLVLLTVVIALIGLLTPTISQKLYDIYIPLGNKRILFEIGTVLGSFLLSNILFSVVKNLSGFRISSRMSYDFQGAIYDRLFNLPEDFLRQYESAELAQRVIGAGSIVFAISSAVIGLVVSAVFLVIFFVRMMSYSVRLSLIGLLMLFLYAVAFYLISRVAIKYRKSAIELNGKTSSIIYQLIGGIEKLRIAGAEDRALFEYIKPYIGERNKEEKQGWAQNAASLLGMGASSLFTLVFYLIIIRGNQSISVGSFIAFSTLFGSFSAYLMQLVSGLVSIKEQKPAMNRLLPVLEALPEYEEGKELPGDLSGRIEVNGVSFSYSPDAPTVLNDINLNIQAGEYVGIVGPSGCGKSTLLKILMGFEKPGSGKVYYDNKDIDSLDKRELRKKLGVVLQNGNLISGSIFENITITAPKATTKDVQAVVKAVGLEKDIQEMPMGLHTMLSEDSGTISGGQQQRILIARAIISNPKILLFDEATSALDNVTQSMVCETLEGLDSTRIVIAHRLSTIINCDRIIVMEAGRIIEEGNYDQLMKKQGLFYQLASRQMA